MDVETLAALGRATGVRAFMTSQWGWPTAESLHFLSLAVLLGSVGLFDLRVLGLARAIPMTAVHRLVPFGIAAFAVNVITGSMFLMTAPGQYLFNPSFRLKVACLAVAGLNVLVFYSAYARRLGEGGPTAPAPVPIRIIAGVSLAAWIGVIIFGRLITYFRPPHHWCFICS
jgi:hypothetical protein